MDYMFKLTPYSSLLMIGFFKAKLNPLCHTRAGGYPDNGAQSWIPACAGMTKAAFSDKKKKPVPKRGLGVSKHTFFFAFASSYTTWAALARLSRE